MLPIDLPEGRYWGHLKPEILELLVQRNRSVKEVYSFYRGWAGLSSKFEQIAEREIWMQEGWNWLKYDKVGQVLASDQEWADVRINYMTSDRSLKGFYQAKVELSGYAMTARNSGNDQILEKVKQYRVSSLNKETSLY